MFHLTPHPRPRRRAFALAFALACALAAPARAFEVLPPGFVLEDVASGAAFTMPVGLAYLPDGALLVAEKRGQVRVVRNGVVLPQPMWQAENEVLNNGDRGLLSVAVDPGFATNRYVYFLYTVDPNGDGQDGDDDAFGRLTRYQVSTMNPDVVDPTTRTVLMGATWTDAPPSGSSTHAIGSLRWGRDGSLLVSIGEGAQFSTMDAGGLDPAMFSFGRTDPIEDIGAFRAQYLGSLGGKVLRINPATGLGYPSNPFATADLGLAQSRVWAYGLRNPFRFAVRPLSGTTDPAAGRPGTLYIADVGWRTWEEISVADAGGRNFGWPCYEGFGGEPEYQAAAPEHSGCGTIGTATNPSLVTAPITQVHHLDEALSSPPGFRGMCVSGIGFYAGFGYPVAWRNRAFACDYGFGTIRALVIDANDQLLGVQEFASDVPGPVDLVTEPATGDLVFIALDLGQVKRIRYTGSVGVAVAPVVAGVRLSEARPNPTTGRVEWVIDLPGPATVTLAIHDAAGREVWRERATHGAGLHPLAWSGQAAEGPAAPGVYIARVEAGGQTLRRRFALVR